jgi:AraC-like DNA-binding protein
MTPALANTASEGGPSWYAREITRFPMWNERGSAPSSEANETLYAPDRDASRGGTPHGASRAQTHKVGQDMRASLAQRPDASDDEPGHVRDRSITIDTILDMLGGELHQPRGTTTIGVLPGVSPRPPDPCPQEGFAAALSLAINEALLGSPRRLERFLPSDPRIEQLLQARGAANEMAKEPARLYLRFLYSAILTWASASETIKSSDQPRPISPLPKWRFTRVRQYIGSHIEQPIRLRDLARAAGLSPMHFAAQFRAYTGISPSEFVMTQRMEHARVLLADPRNTLADVAFSVGFRTQSHFTTTFHRFVGSTPHCWRKTLSREVSTVT